MFDPPLAGGAQINELWLPFVLGALSRLQDQASDSAQDEIDKLLNWLF